MKSNLDFELLDDEGYPTEDALRCIETWDHTQGFNKLMAFVKRIWWPDFEKEDKWGWSEESDVDEWDQITPINRYKISTGGWSGNEEIIRHLQRNYIFWSFCWVQSNRGGHYVFEIKKKV